MSPVIYTHRRFGHRIIKLLLILAIVVGAIFLIRRWNLQRAGVKPKPFLEDMRDVYAQARFKIESGDLSGLIDQVLGTGPIST